MAHTDRLYSHQAADHLGIATATWRRYCSKSPKRRRQAPPADGVDNDRGHARPWWYRQTLDDWQRDRPGRGARTDLRT